MFNVNFKKIIIILFAPIYYVIPALTEASIPVDVNKSSFIVPYNIVQQQNFTTSSKNNISKKSADISGKCGTTLTWTMNMTTGILSITGTGKMDNYDYKNTPPWSNVAQSIRSVNIGKGVTSIGDNAFFNCKALFPMTNSIKRLFEVIPKIHYYQFSGCKNLETVIIPNTVVSIGKRAFQNCAKLSSLNIPSSVTSIKDMAFSGCSRLTSLTYLGENDPGVDSEGVFYNCDKLKYVSVSDSYKDYYFCGKSVKRTLVSGNCGKNVNWLLDTTGTLNVYGKGLMTNYESIDQIPWSSYKNSIESVEIEKGVTSIGSKAFSNCKKLNSVRISNSVDYIGDGAFSGCDNLNSVTYFGEDDPTASSKEVFNGCNKLVSVSVHNNYKSNKFCNLPIEIEVISFALSLDNNYTLPTIVALTSILENANEIIDIYLLHPEDFKDENKEKILSLKEKYKNLNLEFINMKDRFKNANVGGSFKTLVTAAYYRLALPSLLPKVNKIIWLDSDTLTLADLSDFYNLNMDNLYYRGWLDDNDVYTLKDDFGIEDDHYICSGVMLINLEKLRQDNIEYKFKEFIEKNNEKLVQHDQTVINAVCWKNIDILPVKYGIFNCLESQKYHERLIAKNKYSLDEIIEAFKKPIIVHCINKPWKYSNVYFGDVWWEYAKKTDFKNEISKTYNVSKTYNID